MSIHNPSQAEKALFRYGFNAGMLAAGLLIVALYLLQWLDHLIFGGCRS